MTIKLLLKLNLSQLEVRILHSSLTFLSLIVLKYIYYGFLEKNDKGTHKLTSSDTQNRDWTKALSNNSASGSVLSSKSPLPDGQR